MAKSNSPDKPHRRRNLLTGEWVLVSPHRTQRPWQGHEDAGSEPPPAYDKACYLCPGNSRAGGKSNPDYKGVFVFDNDYPALLDDAGGAPQSQGMFQTQPVEGCCRVITYGPRHDVPLHHLDADALERVVETWVAQSVELAERYEWVQIFENRGALMGASSPHPHGQIWAVDALPTEAEKEDTSQREYHAKTKRLLLRDYLQAELEADERLVVVNDHWAALVPYWAIWPYETMLIPRQPVPRLASLSEAERQSLGEILRLLLGSYDRLFDAPMSYSMGWHSAPSRPAASAYWQLHMHIYPPALRSATIPKFMVGFELLAEKQRDITAEIAAQRLRDA